MEPDVAFPETCPVRVVMAYISAAQGLAGTCGRVVVLAGGSRGLGQLTAVQITTALCGHLRQASLPSHLLSTRSGCRGFRVPVIGWSGRRRDHEDCRVEDVVGLAGRYIEHL